MKIDVLKPLGNEIKSSSEMQNDALMHREGLTLSARGSTLDVRI